jgi:hypothetical protein
MLSTRIILIDRGPIGAIIIGCLPSSPIQSALKKLNIQPIRWRAGANVAVLPTAISRRGAWS